MANKNVTGGIVLLLSGSVLVSLVATPKGREIMGILTNKNIERGGGFTSGGTSTPNSKPQSGNGFSEKRGGGFNSSKEEPKTRGSLEAGFVSSTTPDYKTMFGFAGERGAKVI